MIHSHHPFRKISGRFFRSVTLDRIDQVLEPPAAAHAGRYHRHGEPALYTSATLEWAVMAVAGYMRQDHRPHVFIPCWSGKPWCLINTTRLLAAISGLIGIYQMNPGKLRWRKVGNRLPGATLTSLGSPVPMELSTDRV